ncbi:MAG TPA: ABC transporter permease [Phycisphaerae bacterium]|nr:ABC transporter permease [Phycisphaerae bacterium]
MTLTGYDNSTQHSLRPSKSLWADAASRIFRDRIALICLAVILIYAVIAIIIPFCVDWQKTVNYDHTNEPPSKTFLLGTDAFGRSILIKTMLSAHLSMTVAFWANIIAVPLGIFIGAVAGYYGGMADHFITWIFTTLSCIPGIILLIALKFALAGKTIPLGFTNLEMDGIAGLVIALSVTNWIDICRLVRAEVMKLREQDFIMAARCTGRSSFAILTIHIIPNVLHLGIITFSLGFVSAITTEVILSYLNLGVQNAPSWGQMINDARMDLIYGRWWEITSAVIAVFIIVLAWSIFGDRLRDALDPKLKNT